MQIKELRAKRASVIATARELTNNAAKEKRELTADESVQFDKAMDEADELRGSYEKLERLEEAESNLSAHESRARADIGDDGDENRSDRGDPKDDAEAREVELRAAFQSFLMHGEKSLKPEQRQALERRALSVGTATEGGETVPPEQFINQLIKAVDDSVYIRNWGTGFSVANANGLGAPSLDADPADATWTTELAIGSEDSTMAFGKRQLQPNPLAKSIKVSNQLLRQSGLNAEQLVRDRLGYKFGVTWEKAALTGDGTDKPLGVFTASASGIPTSRDIATENTSSAVTMNGLINAKFHLKQGYLAGSRWLFHRDAIKQIAKLRSDSGAGADTGDYIWRESTRVGEPDRLLGVPAFMSEYVPNTFTTGLYVGIIGDFSNYWYADSLNFTIQRLVELYAATNQTGFIGRLESDGMPVLGEAFARVKLG